MGMRGGWVGRWVDPEMNMEDACVYLILHLFQVLLRQHVALIKCEIETGRLTLLPEEGDEWLLTLQTSDHVTEQTFVMCKILENSFTCANVLRFLPISLWNFVIYLSLKDLGNSRIVSSMSIWHACEFQIVDQIRHRLKLNILSGFCCWAHIITYFCKVYIGLLQFPWVEEWKWWNHKIIWTMHPYEHQGFPSLTGLHGHQFP
jgi:hypothetical protein